METLKTVLTSHFVWGLALGLFLCCLSVISHFKTKRELKRYQKHLSDKLEIEAQQFETLKREKENLRAENENLRLKISANSSQSSSQSLERELEIFARAERTMMVNAPGFAPAWENAKSAALGEIEEEERGRSLPRRFFRKFFKDGSRSLPSHSAGGESLLEHHANGEEESSSASAQSDQEKRGSGGSSKSEKESSARHS